MPLPIVLGGAALAGKTLAGMAGKTAAGVAGKAVAGQTARMAAGQVASQAGQQAARNNIGRTASGQMLQATKPRNQWDWKNMSSNFAPMGGNNSGDFV